MKSRMFVFSVGKPIKKLISPTNKDCNEGRA